MSRNLVVTMPKRIATHNELINIRNKPGKKYSISQAGGTRKIIQTATMIKRLCASTTKFRHAIVAANIVNEKFCDFISPSAFKNVEVPSIIMADMNVHMTRPAATNGKNVSRLTFHNRDQTTPIAVIKKARLKVFQSGPSIVRMYFPFTSRHPSRDHSGQDRKPSVISLIASV